MNFLQLRNGELIINIAAIVSIEQAGEVLHVRMGDGRTYPLMGDDAVTIRMALGTKHSLHAETRQAN